MILTKISGDIPLSIPSEYNDSIILNSLDSINDSLSNSRIFKTISLSIFTEIIVSEFLKNSIFLISPISFLNTLIIYNVIKRSLILKFRYH